MIQISNGVVSIKNSSFNKLSSKIYSSLVSLTSNEMTVSFVNVSGFDKTLFVMSSGDYSFDNVAISNGSNTLLTSYNSVVFDAESVNISLTNSKFRNFSSLFSSPILYAYNDDSSTY